MEKALVQIKSASGVLSYVCLALLGCCLISICSWIKIPFYPIPFTLQTFAVFFLALTQSPKLAFGSVICYLVCGTLGLPVFNAMESMWWMGKSGGYLIAFPFAAYLTSALARRYSPLLAVICGQAVIYALGFIWLVNFVEPKTAFVYGIAIFLPSCVFKMLLAVGSAKVWKKWSSR